jgi:hypothetical protein
MWWYASLAICIAGGILAAFIALSLSHVCYQFRQKRRGLQVWESTGIVHTPPEMQI